MYAPTESFSYLVWNRGLKEDLELLHRIPSTAISIVGSTQLCYLKEYMTSENTKSKIEGDYIYFGASCGRISMIKQELSFLISLSNKLEISNPTCKILFRPYPNVSDVSVYNELKDHTNIIFDEYMNDGMYALDKEGFFEKYSHIVNSLAVMHTGSTFGLESTYFKVPTFMYTFKDETSSDISFHLKCSNAMKQHHLKKYLCIQSPNVINTKVELESIIEEIFSSNTDLLIYNEIVASQTPLFTLDSIKKRILLSFEHEV